MSIAQSVPSLLQEMADLVASHPTREHLLNYRPSEPIRQRAGELLIRQNAGALTGAEQDELHQYEWAETLMRLVKAKLRQDAVSRP